MTMRPDIVAFATSPAFLGLSLSPAQETLLRGIYGLPLVADEQRDLWRLCTGRESYRPPPGGFSEVTVIAGARAGKNSRIAAPVALYEAIFGGHDRYLSRGERAVIPVVAQDQRATRIAFSYLRGYVTDSRALSSLLDSEPLASEMRLSTRVDVVCFPCTLRSLRGWSIPAGIMDEVGFWRLEGEADSDVEVQASIRRGAVSFAKPRLVKVSTPYLKCGVLFDDFKAAFGTDDPDRLVWRASSVLMNPSLASRLERERRLDPERFRREYEAEFAEDVSTFLPSAWIEAAVVSSRHEVAPAQGMTYTAAVDASGGGRDAFSLAIVHVEGQGVERRVVQDVMKSWRSSRTSTLNLEGVVAEAVEIVRRYHVARIVGDRYAAGWVKQSFERHAITYSDPSMDRSGAYLGSEALFAQGSIEILDHPETIHELRNLERRRRSGGKVVVDHPGGTRYSDDHANTLCLAAAVAIAKPSFEVGWASVGGREIEETYDQFGRRIAFASWRPLL